MAAIAVAARGGAARRSRRMRASLPTEFVRGLAANGTTTALVFGSHFPDAQEALFSAAFGGRAPGRVGPWWCPTAGLLPSLLDLGVDALAASRELIERWHGRGLLRYAVSPRFSVSCSEQLLSACGALLREVPGLLVTSHLNESPGEIELVASLFPWAGDYLETYERFGLVGAGSVFAHDIHVERRRTGDGSPAAGAAVAHCPSSNAFLGSGLFPMRRHLDFGVRVALGTDVGAGTGLSMLKEGLMAYQVQMLLGPAGAPLGPAELLWLATAAGAAALGLADEIGDFERRQERGFRAGPTAGGQHARRGARARRVDRGEARGAVHARARGVDRGGAGGRAGRLMRRARGRGDGCVRRRGAARRGGLRRRRFEHARAPGRAGRRAAVADAGAVGAGVDRPALGGPAGVGPGGLRPAAPARAREGVDDRALGADGGRAAAARCRRIRMGSRPSRARRSRTRPGCGSAATGRTAAPR